MYPISEKKLLQQQRAKLAPLTGLMPLVVAMDPTQTSATISFMMLAGKLALKCRHAHGHGGEVRWGLEMADGGIRH